MMEGLIFVAELSTFLFLIMSELVGQLPTKSIRDIGTSAELDEFTQPFDQSLP